MILDSNPMEKIHPIITDKWSAEIDLIYFEWFKLVKFMSWLEK